MRYWEINGNLSNPKTGIANYQIFSQIISDVKNYFDMIFGIEQMNKILFYVDNATANSGHTPIVTPVLGKLAIIKLGIAPGDWEPKIAFQFAHELTHVVFYTYLGMDKPKANDEEEMICTAASLIIIKQMYPEQYVYFENDVKANSYVGYRNGVAFAEKISYDMKQIRSAIENFSY